MTSESEAVTPAFKVPAVVTPVTVGPPTTDSDEAVVLKDSEPSLMVTGTLETAGVPVATWA